MPLPSTSRLIVPGARVGGILLGKPFPEKTKVDGCKPRVTHEIREKSLMYEAAGMDLCISAITNELKSISLYLGLGGRHEDFQGATACGLRPGATEAEIVKHLGSPDKIGDSYPMPRKRKSRRWLSYDRGIAFEFAADGRADLITVFRGRG